MKADTLENNGLPEGRTCIGDTRRRTVGAILILLLYGSAHNYAAFWGAPGGVGRDQNNADSAVVHPDWRATVCSGSCWKRRCLCPPRHQGIGATAHPENQYSPNNAPACGLSIIIADRREMHGGTYRYLLKKINTTKTPSR